MADAIALFRLVAGPDPAYDEAAAVLAVQLCGRLPLAIQLAAGGMAHDYPPRLADLVEELSQSPVLAVGTGAASPQVMSAFDVSYGSLEPDHQRFFRRLGMSPCAAISPPAAAALGGVTLAEAQQALTALLDHHLLAPAPGSQFRFHDLIREYAALRAEREDSGAERRRAVSRLLDYYLDTADRADRVLHPFRRRMPVPVAPARGQPGPGHPGRRGGLAGRRVAQHPAGRAVRRAARMEAEVRRPHSRAGRLPRGQRVLGGGPRGAHPGHAGRPGPGQPGPGRAGRAGVQRGEPADRPA